MKPVIFWIILSAFIFSVVMDDSPVFNYKVFFFRWLFTIGAICMILLASKELNKEGKA